MGNGCVRVSGKRGWGRGGVGEGGMGVGGGTTLVTNFPPLQPSGQRARQVGQWTVRLAILSISPMSQPRQGHKVTSSNSSSSVAQSARSLSENSKLSDPHSCVSGAM